MMLPYDFREMRDRHDLDILSGMRSQNRKTLRMTCLPRIALLGAILLGITSGAAHGQAAALAVVGPMPELPVPDGWYAELKPFPLDFAPNIPYEGSLELRFMPDMFNPRAADYFSYAYLWWVKGQPVFGAKELAQDLTMYYQGLAESVGGGLQLTIPPVATSVTVDRSDDQHFVAKVHTLDAFNGARPLDLRIEVTVQPYRQRIHTAVFFAVTAADATPAVRTAVDAVVTAGTTFQ
jgi:hypothetical protein